MPGKSASRKTGNSGQFTMVAYAENLVLVMIETNLIRADLRHSMF
jgi:hypothetical protein